MRVAKRLLGLCACAAALAGPLARAAPPAEAFGMLPAQTDVAISPDGRSLAWIDHTAPVARVILFDLGARRVQRSLGVPEFTKLRSIEWADRETLLITVSQTAIKEIGEQDQVEVYRVIAADVAGGVGRMLLMDDSDRRWMPAASMIAVHVPRPKTVVMASADFSATAGHAETGTRLAGHRSDSFWVKSAFEVDTRTGKGTLLERGTQFTDDFVLDREGRVAVREEWDGVRHIYRVLGREGRGWRQLYRRDDGTRLTLAGLSNDGAAVVALGANGGRHIAVWTLPLDGSAPAILIEDPTDDITHVIRNDYTGTVVGAYVSGLKSTIKWIDPGAEERNARVQRAFPGRQVSIDNVSADGERTVVRVQTPSSPPVYYVVDFGAHTADVAGEEYPALSNVALGEVRSLTYAARDGTPIPAFLTLPAAKPDKPVPLIVFPHGGPEERDYLGFDWMPQFLASRGYAVIQPQFRGSTGFGETFRLAGYRQWGGLMQDDVTDAVRAMVEQGIADPARICIVGASYGGYAALAGAAFTPKLYKCAVSISGVSDLPAMMGEVQRWSRDKEYDAVGYWRDSIGVLGDPKLIEKSPIHAVASIEAPILLIHGTDDSVVSMPQSELMARALEAAGKSVRFVRLEGEDHWMSRSADRIRILKELESFLHEHL